jgi:uncharacterized protein (TIGR02145 family)
MNRACLIKNTNLHEQNQHASSIRPIKNYFVRMKNKIFIYPIISLVFVIVMTFGCKKDEEIVKKDPVITWGVQSDITVGTLLGSVQLNATADVAGTFVYNPVTGTQLSEGASQNLKADFTPTDAIHYNTASKTVKINVVARKNPVITWTNPADITYGTLLSNTQLNAIADVSGVFLYTPLAGTKLSTGANQDLKADFTPTDMVNYNVASKTVKINVTAPLPLTLTDKDGNIYKTVTLGTQIWMAENLRTTKYNDGTDIPKVTVNNDWYNLTTDAYCWYNNDETAFKDTYGALYNGFAANTKLCPTGWHIPSNADWTDLGNYLTIMVIITMVRQQAANSLKHWQLQPDGLFIPEQGQSAIQIILKNEMPQVLQLILPVIVSIMVHATAVVTPHTGGVQPRLLQQLSITWVFPITMQVMPYIIQAKRLVFLFVV